MARMTYTLPSHVELTVRRPDGSVETIRAEKLGGYINDAIFTKVVAATKAGGRGDVLSYRNVTREHTETDAEMAERERLEAIEAARAAPRWQTDPSMGFAGERDECAGHGSRREPAHKED